MIRWVQETSGATGDSRNQLPTHVFLTSLAGKLTACKLSYITLIIRWLRILDMGSAKRQWEETQGEKQIALMLLVESGVIRECQYHPGTYFEGNEPIEAAYKLANTRISENQAALPHGYSRRQYTDLIKSVYEDHSGLDSCPCCDRTFNRD